MSRRRILIVAAVLALAAGGASTHRDVAGAAPARPCTPSDLERLRKLEEEAKNDLVRSESGYDTAQILSANYFLAKGHIDPDLDRQLTLRRLEVRDSRKILDKAVAAREACSFESTPRPAPPADWTPQPLDTGDMNDEPTYAETFARGDDTAHVRAAQGFRWLTFGATTTVFDQRGWLWFACPRRAGGQKYSFACNYTFKISDPSAPGEADRGIRYEGRGAASLVINGNRDSLELTLDRGGMKTDFSLKPPKKSYNQPLETLLWTLVKQ